jgi:hypothetical protein
MVQLDPSTISSIDLCRLEVMELELLHPVQLGLTSLLVLSAWEV